MPMVAHKSLVSQAGQTLSVPQCRSLSVRGKANGAVERGKGPACEIYTRPQTPPPRLEARASWALRMRSRKV